MNFNSFLGGPAFWYTFKHFSTDDSVYTFVRHMKLEGGRQGGGKKKRESDTKGFLKFCFFYVYKMYIKLSVNPSPVF